MWNLPATLQLVTFITQFCNYWLHKQHNNSCSCDILIPLELGELRYSEVYDSFENICFSMSSIQNEIIFSIPRQKKHGLNTGGKTGEGPWWSGLFNSKIKVFAKENLCFFETVYMFPEKQRNSYHGSWLENLISRIVLKINFHLQLRQEDWSSSLFRGTALLMNKYNYFKDKPKML